MEKHSVISEPVRNFSQGVSMEFYKVRKYVDLIRKWINILQLWSYIAVYKE